MCGSHRLGYGKAFDQMDSKMLETWPDPPWCDNVPTQKICCRFELDSFYSWDRICCYEQKVGLSIWPRETKSKAKNRNTDRNRKFRVQKLSDKILASGKKRNYSDRILGKEQNYHRNILFWLILFQFSAIKQRALTCFNTLSGNYLSTNIILYRVSS